ncbi:MAG: hypothetical protein ACYYKD_06755 [Rhodospirillales bacterium]
MSANPPPVPCPKCAERQNVSPGAFDPDDPSFRVHCMACGHKFSPIEYKMGLAAVMNEPPKGLAAKAGARTPATGRAPGDA